MLGDCEQLLGAITVDMPMLLWRTRWAELVALLRAAGHIPDKLVQVLGSL